MISSGAGGACGGAIGVSELAWNALEALGGAGAVGVGPSRAEALRIGPTGAEGAGSTGLTVGLAGRKLETRCGGR